MALCMDSTYNSGSWIGLGIVSSGLVSNCESQRLYFQVPKSKLRYEVIIGQSEDSRSLDMIT